MTTRNATEQKTENAIAIATEVGKDFHYRDVEVTFGAFRDFKVKWTRSYSWISFTLSDYLLDAPDDVLRDIFTTIFGRIRGDIVPYSDNVTEWVSAPEFALRNQPIYCSRDRQFRDAEGKVFDLRDILNGLSSDGLIDSDLASEIRIGWGKAGAVQTGRSSVLMKVICINEDLDSNHLSEEELSYCVYREVCHIMLGFDPICEDRRDQWLDACHEFPNWEEIEDHLSSIHYEF